jgi:hypothetical protein
MVALIKLGSCVYVIAKTVVGERVRGELIGDVKSGGADTDNGIGISTAMMALGIKSGVNPLALVNVILSVLE